MPIIKKQQNFADFVSDNTGTMNALFLVAALNGASITDDFTAGVLLNIIQTASLPVYPAIVIQPYVSPTVGTIVKKHENFADFVSNHTGTINALFAVAAENGKSITDDYTGGEILNVISISSLPVFAPANVAAYVPDTVNKVLKKHQNNTDFVAQHFGTMESIFQLAALNGISITENPVPGVTLKTQTTDDNVVSYYMTAVLDIASKQLPPKGTMPPGGIGYMKITNPANPQSNDFIVS